MQQTERVGSWSLAGAGAAIQLVQVFHPIPLFALRAGFNAAWLAVVVAGFTAMALFWIGATAISRLPDGNLLDLARSAAGEPTAVGTALLVSGLLIYHAGLVIRETSEMAISSVYPHTPQTFATVSLALCALYGAFGALPGLVRVSLFLLPFVAGAILMILVGSLGWGEVRWLLPIFGPGLGPLIGGGVKLSGIFGPFPLFLLVAARDLRGRHHLRRSGAVAIAGSSLLLAMTLAVLAMTFPNRLGWSVTFALHHMARLVLGGRFFERIEGVWVFTWVFGTACHLALVVHTAAAAYADGFRMKSHRAAVLPIVVMAVTVAFFPPDQGQTVARHNWVLPMGLWIGLLLPAVLAGAAFLRRRWVNHGA